jgi:hypothetical protein
MSTFFHDINEKEAGQFISLAANSIQLIQAAVQLYELFSGGGDTSEILDKLDELEQELQVDFQQLGQLMIAQIGDVIDNENTIAVAQAQAESATALDELSRFYQTKNAEDLALADHDSDLAVQFFLNLPVSTGDPREASQSNPFFLPGMIKAASARVSVMIANDGIVNSVPADVQEVKEIVAMCQGLINAVTTKVTNAHLVTLHETGPHGPVPPPKVLGYSHDEDGEELAFFSAGAGTAAEITKAQSEAEAARKAGIGAELAYIGIPAFQSLVNSWAALAANPKPELQRLAHPDPAVSTVAQVAQTTPAETVAAKA